MHRERRSGCIAKELDIVQLGTDAQRAASASNTRSIAGSNYAAPFSPGETALFVSAKIKRIEALSGGKVFRYGVEYVNSIPARSC